MFFNAGSFPVANTERLWRKTPCWAPKWRGIKWRQATKHSRATFGHRLMISDRLETPDPFRERISHRNFKTNKSKWIKNSFTRHNIAIWSCRTAFQSRAPKLIYRNRLKLPKVLRGRAPEVVDAWNSFNHDPRTHPHRRLPIVTPHSRFLILTHWKQRENSRIFDEEWPGSRNQE